MNLEPRKWDKSLSGEMTLGNIRNLYQPESDYRISWNEYPPETDFGGWSLKRRLYVVNGSCSITVKEHSLNLIAGEFADLPEGDYYFAASSHSQVEIISVWEIPKQ